MSRIAEATDGRALEHNIPFETGYGLTHKAGLTPLLGALDRTLRVMDQTIDMADATHTLVVNTTATTGQTRITGGVLYVDPNSAGAGENLVFPAEADIADLFLVIRNTGDERIYIQNDTPALVGTIGPQSTGLVTCDGTNLRVAQMAGTSPAFTNLLISGYIDQDEALTGAGNGYDMDVTVNHATANVFGIDLTLTQLTTARTGGSMTGYKVTLNGLAGDSGGTYKGIGFVAEDNGGSGSFIGLTFDAGWDAILDISSCLTGEADVILGGGLASAMTWRTASTDFMSLDTTTNLWALDLDATIDQAYTSVIATGFNGISSSFTLSDVAGGAGGVGLVGHAISVQAGVDRAATAGPIIGKRITLAGRAGDHADARYIGLDFVTDGLGAGEHNGIRFDAGWDAIMDLSLCGTGEADINMPAAAASAFSFRQGTTDYLTFATNTPGIASFQRFTTTDGVASGTSRTIGGKVYERVADSAALVGVNGGGADPETVIDTVTIPANTIKEGTRVKFKATARITVGATAGTLQMAVRLGGVGGQLIAQNTAADPGAAGQLWTVEGEIIGRAAPSATSSCVHNGECASLFYASGAAPAAVFKSSAIANQATNGALTLVITGLWNSATNDAVVVQDFTAEVIG